MHSPEIIRRLWESRVAVGTAAILSFFGTAGVELLTQQQTFEALQRVPPSRFQTKEVSPKRITFYRGPSTSLTPDDAVTIDISDIPASSSLVKAYEKMSQARARREYAASLQNQNLLVPKATGGIALFLAFGIRFITLGIGRRSQ